MRVCINLGGALYNNNSRQSLINQQEKEISYAVYFTKMISQILSKDSRGFPYFLSLHYVNNVFSL